MNKNRYHGNVAEPRAPLLQAVLRFVLDGRICRGVLRMALIGSLTTEKPLPKDADVLVTIEDSLDLGPLTRAARRRAEHCGRQGHLNDDLQVLTLAPALIESPPVELWPEIHRRVPVPSDVEELLLAGLATAG
jgi:hypothetical protein